MAQFTFYQSTDASAPTLTGQAGSLIALLDAVLVNGYGSKSGAGWSHPFPTSLNIAMYTPGSGTQRILLVQDDASLTGSGRDSIIRGVESATSLLSVTNTYPTVAQQTNGVNWRKSSTADSTARPWWIFADSRTMYMMVQTGDTGATSGIYPLYMFGDFYSYNASDTFNSLLIGCIGSATSENFGSTGFNQSDQYYDILQSSFVGHYKPRLVAGGSGTLSIKCGKVVNSAFFSTAGNTTNQATPGVLSYPNTNDGCMYLANAMINDATTPDNIHGELRGLYYMNHGIQYFTDQDTFNGLPGSGQTFKVFRTTPFSGLYVFETSNTLKTN